MVGHAFINSSKHRSENANLHGEHISHPSIFIVAAPRSLLQPSPEKKTQLHHCNVNKFVHNPHFLQFNHGSHTNLKLLCHQWRTQQPCQKMQRSSDHECTCGSKTLILEREQFWKEQNPLIGQSMVKIGQIWSNVQIWSKTGQTRGV